MRKLLPTPPRNDRQTRRKQHKHQCNEKGRRSLPHGEPNGGLPSYALFFFSLGVQVTPVHKSALLHLWNVASRWAKLKCWKIEFLQLFHSKSGALYAKTPHFRAVFSVLHLSSTHLGPSGETWTHDPLTPSLFDRQKVLEISRICRKIGRFANSETQTFAIIPYIPR